MTAYRDGEVIVVVIPARLTRAQEARYVPGLVERLLQKETKQRVPKGNAELRDRAAWLAEQYLRDATGRPPQATDVSWVSTMTKRWASCTIETRTIRLSDRLQSMPNWVVDYVILHELAHLIVRDHNSQFWALLDAYPQTARARGYLEGWLAGQAGR